MACAAVRADFLRRLYAGGAKPSGSFMPHGPTLSARPRRTVDRRAATDRDAAMLDLAFLALGAALFLAALVYARACANI